MNSIYKSELLICLILSLLMSSCSSKTDTYSINSFTFAVPKEYSFVEMTDDRFSDPVPDWVSDHCVVADEDKGIYIGFLEYQDTQEIGFTADSVLESIKEDLVMSNYTLINEIENSDTETIISAGVFDGNKNSFHKYIGVYSDKERVQSVTVQIKEEERNKYEEFALSFLKSYSIR